MVKPPRSPLVGYNHNLTHLGRVFHIQTEDSGPVSPRLFTHLFYEGTILVSRKHEYVATLADDKVRALMQAQHKTVMKDLLRGRLDGVIIPFFASRGEEVAPVQGALPTAALSETDGPVMVLPDGPAAATAAATATAATAAAEAEAKGTVSDSAEGGATIANATTSVVYDPAEMEIPGAPPTPAPPASAPTGPRRTSTRKIEGSGVRESGPARVSGPRPVVVRAPDARRSPFVRSGSPMTSRMTSADGVVMQRNVVVGGGPAAPPRVRAPVPYVVTGGGHADRSAKSASASASASASPPAHTTGATPSRTETPSPFVKTSVAHPASTASSSATAESVPGESVPRATGGFGVGLAEDKSLDEVILEYLSDDSDSR